MYKHPRNVSKRFQKNISSRTKDIKQFSQLYTDTQTHIVNLELTPPEGGSAKNVCSNMVASIWTNEFLIMTIQLIYIPSPILQVEKKFDWRIPLVKVLKKLGSCPNCHDSPAPLWDKIPTKFLEGIYTSGGKYQTRIY